MIVQTVCRLCSSCCPVEVEIDNGRLLAARRKSPLPEARQIPCPKLAAAPDIVYAPDRLQQPLIKDGHGKFQEASWDEALDLVAERFQFFKKAHGAESVCWLRGMAADWGAPWDYANRLMNGFGSPNTIGNGSVCYVGRVFAHAAVYGAVTFPQPQRARCILVWGKNDHDTNPGAAEAILEARRNSARLIVVDPVRTPLAEQADIWLRVKPAHDGPLAMAMIHEIISADLHDADFVDNWTVGFEELRRAAARFPAETVAERLWLRPEEIREAARLYATTRPACIVDGSGLDMQLDSFDATRAVCMLRALTGNLDVPGGDFLAQPVPARNIQLKERLPAGVGPITEAYPLFNGFSDFWGNQVQSCVTDAILEGKPYPVRMLVSQSGNPAVSLMDSDRVRRALEQLDFLVVIDMFMNRTAKMADVVLPACSCFEKTQLNRAALRNSLVVLQNQVIDPLGSSWPDWKIIFALGRRLGLHEEFPWQSAEEAIDYQLAPTGITVRKLREQPDGVHAVEVRHKKYEGAGFKTPSGKVELFSRKLHQHGHAPVPFADGFPDGPISFSDQAEHYPLLGTSGARTSRFTHSQFFRIPSLVQGEKGCAVDIHPADAAAHGIKEGDRIRVETPRGSLTMPAHLCDEAHQGVIRIAWGWGELDPACNLNSLTDDQRRNPVIGTPSGRNFMCRITRIAGQNPVNPGTKAHV
ncbi:MAG: molybdopterin-containing oxidoreductase family protein [Desulfobulbaceae bacterium]